MLSLFLSLLSLVACVPAKFRLPKLSSRPFRSSSKTMPSFSYTPAPVVSPAASVSSSGIGHSIAAGAGIGIGNAAMIGVVNSVVGQPSSSSGSSSSVAAPMISCPIVSYCPSDETCTYTADGKASISSSNILKRDSIGRTLGHSIASGASFTAGQALTFGAMNSVANWWNKPKSSQSCTFECPSDRSRDCVISQDGFTMVIYPIQ